MNSTPEYHLSFSCKEKWEDMAKVEGGRHCAKCQHQVYDFTGMTPLEVQAYLKARQGQRICGRVRHGTFEIRSLTRRPCLTQKVKTFVIALLAALGLLAGNPAQAYAQTGETSMVAETGIISGQVLDDDNYRVEFAAVLLKNPDGIIVGGANSDENGNFKIWPVLPGEYTMEARYAGINCDPKPLTIKAGEEIEMTFKIKHSDFPDLGIIEIPRETIDLSSPSQTTLDQEDLRNRGR